MREYAVMSQMPKHGMSAVALIALLGMVGVPQAVRATVLVRAMWDNSTSLTYAAGGNLAPTVTGTVGLAPGKFGQGVSLPTTSDKVSYALPTGFDKTQGTISFWYQAEKSTAQFPLGVSGSVLSIGNFVGIQYSGGGQFGASVGGGLTYNTSLSWNQGDWLYFAFEWDANQGAAGMINLWVGKSGTVPYYYNAGGYAPPAATPGTINIGANGMTYGVWDDLYISDTLLYPSLTSSINVPTDALTVPEPSIILLLGLGTAALWFRRRANRRAA